MEWPGGPEEGSLQPRIPIGSIWLYKSAVFFVECYINFKIIIIIVYLFVLLCRWLDAGKDDKKTKVKLKVYKESKGSSSKEK